MPLKCKYSLSLSNIKTEVFWVLNPMERFAEFPIWFECKLWLGKQLRGNQEKYVYFGFRLLKPNKIVAKRWNEKKSNDKKKRFKIIFAHMNCAYDLAQLGEVETFACNSLYAYKCQLFQV